MKIFLIVTLAILLTLPTLSLAQPTGGGSFETGGGGFENTGSGGTNLSSTTYGTHGGRLPNLLRVDSVGGLVNKIIDYLILIAAPILAIFILIGAYQIMFAGGDTEKWKTGKKTIIYAVIGYAIILLSKGVASIIQSAF